MIRTVRRLLGVAGVAALASTAFVGAVSAPAPAATETFGYTIQVQFPAGTGPQCRPARVDLTTGAITPIGAFQSATTMACANDLALSPTGELYGISDANYWLLGAGSTTSDTTASTSATTAPTAAPEAQVLSVHLVRFDTTSGAATDLGVIGTPGSDLTGRLGAGGITFDAAGHLFVQMVGRQPQCDDLDAFCLYQVDPTNPTNATFLGGASSDNYMFGLTSTCAGTVYNIEQASTIDSADSVLNPGGGDQLDTVNPTNGATAAVGTLASENELLQSLDFTSGGTLVGLGGQLPNGIEVLAHLYTIDPTTGAATQGVALSSSSRTIVMGLAIAPLNCTPPPVELQPTFTG